MSGSRLAAWLLILIAVLASPVNATETVTDGRVALVIGNAAYPDGGLRKPIADADAAAALFQHLGFEVIRAIDADGAGLRAAADRFGERLAVGRGIGVAYYSGHAARVDGVNYLIPTDLPPNADPIAVRTKSLSLNYLRDRMRAARPGRDVVLIDACRGAVGGDAPGLAPVSPGAGGLIAFAVQAGADIDEGPASEPNSRFTAALTRAVSETPTAPLDEILKRVNESVVKDTDGRQVPEYTYAGGTDPIVLASPAPVEPPPAAPPRKIEPPGVCYDAVRSSTPSEYLPKDLGAYCYNLRDGTQELGRGNFDKALAAYEKATAAAAALADPAARALAADEARAAKSLALEGKGEIAAALALMARPREAARDVTAPARGYQLARNGLYKEAAVALDAAGGEMPDFVCELDRRAADTLRGGHPLDRDAQYGVDPEDDPHLPSYLFPSAIVGCVSKCKCVGVSPPFPRGMPMENGRLDAASVRRLSSWMETVHLPKKKTTWTWTVAVHAFDVCREKGAACDRRLATVSERRARELVKALSTQLPKGIQLNGRGMGRREGLTVIPTDDPRQNRISLIPKSSED